MIFWTVFLLVAIGSVGAIFIAFRRGSTIQELVRNPPPEVDLPEFVTILSYLHHELIKHRLPLVRTVADQPLDAVDAADVEMLKQAVTGASGRPSLIAELEGYLAGLRRAAGSVHLNFWRDPMVRRARRACKEIEAVAEGIGEHGLLTEKDHKKLREADMVLDKWFRPRLQAIRNSVLSLQLEASLFDEPVDRVCRELGITNPEIKTPDLEEPWQVRILRPDFNLVIRNLIRNGLQRSIRTTGENRLAIELAHRIELTGEESVLIRIHDTDPTMLTRQALYGGMIGRGLNLVTTTLRRYDGAVSCKRSKLDGFAKAMEVRLFQADASVEDQALLRRADPLGRALPAALMALMLALGGVSVAGIAGAIPDPLVAMGILSAPTDQEALAKAKESVSEANTRILGAQLRASVAALKASPMIKERQIPGPGEISVDTRRCKPQRSPEDRRLQLDDCNLVRPNGRLYSPLLLLQVDKDYDVGKMRVSVKDYVLRGLKRELYEGPNCSKVTLVAPKQKVPEDIAARLPISIPRVSSHSRIFYDYLGCLRMPRYPIHSRIVLQGPEGTPDGLDSLKPTTIQVQVEVRRTDEARDAYARISNDDKTLPNRSVRTALVQAIARSVTEEIRYDQRAGGEIDQKDLAAAIYFGWVRAGLYNGIWMRVERGQARQGPTDQICSLVDQIQEGVDSIQELDPKVVNAELYRSQYYALQAQLWIEGDTLGAMQALDAFQSQFRAQTDFVQGARLTMALVLALIPPTDRVLDKDGRRRLNRMTALLKALRRDARKPPKKHGDFLYNKVKLLGIRPLLGPGDEGADVNDALCAFGRVHVPWLEVMEDDDYNNLFNHCPGFERREPPPEPDIDAGDLPDVGLSERPTPDAGPPKTIRKFPVTDRVERISRYFEAFGELMRTSRWDCKEVE